MHDDVLGLQNPFLHDFGSAQLVAAHQQVYFGAELGQIGRFLRGRVAAAYHSYLHAPEEKAVAHRASRNPFVHQALFRLQAQPFRTGTGGDDDGFRMDDRTALRPQRMGRRGEIHFCDFLISDFRAKTFRLLAQVVHHLRPQDAVRIAREVLHVGGDHQLSARFVAGVHQGLHICAGGVNSSGVACWASTYDDACLGFCCLSHISFDLSHKSKEPAAIYCDFCRKNDPPVPVRSCNGPSIQQKP